MEAAKPIDIVTNKPEDNEIFKEEKSYLIESDNKNYNLYIKNFSSYIILFCSYKTEDINKYEYEQKYLLEQFKNNKYLAICDSIDEVYVQLKMEFDKNSTKIKEDNDTINISIPINHIKIKEITFDLPKKIKSENEKIEDLKEEISFLIKENKDLKISLEQLKKENICILDKLNNLEKSNKILLGKIEKIEKLEKLYENNQIDTKAPIETHLIYTQMINSQILKDDIDKQNTIFNWIKEKTEKNDIKFELLFRKSENGIYSDDFHKYCDNKGPTLSLIETSDNIIIGGFTPINWVGDKKGKIEMDYSNQTFIFSFKTMKKYDLIAPNERKALFNVISFGPNFGGGNLRLEKNLNFGVTNSNSKCSFIDNDENELTGKNQFETKELEVFKVLY